ncbi:MAG: GNAT family N-acetyltransferase [Clostridiales bacterium]|nr:GNAT family N-acetyltransferase [Clostridiales bacterium]
METLIQNSEYPNMYKMDGFAEYTWQNTSEENELIFCIIEKVTDAYCGFCNLRNFDTNTPEIGISLLKEHQCKGIGRQALTMMMDTYSATHEVAYYVARIRIHNTHSRHLVEKMGAVQYREEDSEFKQAVDKLMSNPDETIRNVLGDGQEEYEDENRLVVYHLGARG